MPPSPPSCRWMSMPTPRRSAMAKIASRWPSRSPSMPTGSRPPSRSAPSAMAASSSSAVPGERRMPLCGKATIWIVTRSRKRSRTFRISWRLLRPSWLSMSTWLRMCSVPLATTWRTRLAPVSGFGTGPRRAHLAFGLDAIGDAVARRLVGHPGQAEQGLVEMDVAVDQRRQQTRMPGSHCDGGRKAAMRPSFISISCRAPSGRVALRGSLCRQLTERQRGWHGLEGPRRGGEAAARAVGHLDVFSPTAAHIFQRRDRACRCRGNRARRPSPRRKPRWPNW